MKIGFIGVGSMARAIIPLLIRAGHHVSTWNRSHAAMMDLEGVSVLESPSSAFQQEVVISLLADDTAVREVLLSRSEEHTSELQSLTRNSYAVFCLKKKT